MAKARTASHSNFMTTSTDGIPKNRGSVGATRNYKNMFSNSMIEKHGPTVKSYREKAAV